MKKNWKCGNTEKSDINKQEIRDKGIIEERKESPRFRESLRFFVYSSPLIFLLLTSSSTLSTAYTSFFCVFIKQS